MVSWRLADQETRLSPRKTQKTSGGATSVRATCPICIGIGNDRGWSGGNSVSTQIKRTLDVPDDVFDEIEMRGSWGMHKETCLMNDIGNFGTGESKVMKSTREAAIESRIVEEIAGIDR
jgi:hypothetical protein